MIEKETQEARYFRYPAQVLGCLSTGKLTITLCSGVGMANGGVNIEIPVAMIPFDLRMPNSQFDVLREVGSGVTIKVLRKDENYLGQVNSVYY